MAECTHGDRRAIRDTSPRVSDLARALPGQRRFRRVRWYVGSPSTGFRTTETIALAEPAHASAVCSAAFERGLLMETSGPRSEVVKLLPPLTTTADELAEGLAILAGAVDAVLT